MKSPSFIIHIVILGFITIFIVWVVVLNKKAALTFLSNYSQKMLMDIEIAKEGSNSRTRNIDNTICNDTIWCNIAMPTKSYFRFDPPDDVNRWKIACSLSLIHI